MFLLFIYKLSNRSFYMKFRKLRKRVETESSQLFIYVHLNLATNAILLEFYFLMYVHHFFQSQKEVL